MGGGGGGDGSHLKCEKRVKCVHDANLNLRGLKKFHSIGTCL